MALSQIRFWLSTTEMIFFFVILDPVTSSITLYLDVESFSMAMAGVCVLRCTILFDIYEVYIFSKPYILMLVMRRKKS